MKAKGTLIVAADATYAPNEFIAPDGHTVIGMDADLAHALFPLLGLKANVVNATFDTIIPGLTSGKFDVGMSSFTDTKAREQQVNFVDYFTAGESFFEARHGGPKVTACEHLRPDGGGGVRHDRADRRADASPRSASPASKTAVTVLTFPDQNSANLAVASRPCAARLRRLAGRRLPGAAVARQVQARRRELRQRAVRHRRAEVLGHAGQGDPRRAEGPGQERPVRRRSSRSGASRRAPTTLRPSTGATS